MTTDEIIYFYIIDKETLIPKLENAMKNFLKCSQLMFGSRKKYGISYKQNQSEFSIYTRKFYHNYKVDINQDNFEGAVGCNLQWAKRYVVAHNEIWVRVCD